MRGFGDFIIIFTGDKILILCIKHLRERETLFNFIEVSSENEITENSVVYDKSLPYAPAIPSAEGVDRFDKQMNKL